MRCTAVMLALLGAAPAVHATQLVPIGQAFHVSHGGSPDDPNVGYAITPKVAAAADGSFVVVWEGQDSNGFTYGVFGRRYAPGATPLGAEFEIGPRDAYYVQPDVATDPAGGFLVVWADTPAVSVQRFDASGAAQGPLIRADQTGGGFNELNRNGIVVAPDGSFVVVWRPRTFTSENIVLRRFDPSGAPLGDEFQVNDPGTVGNYPAIAALGDQGFIVAWKHYVGVPAPDDIYARLFDWSGTPRGPGFLAVDSDPDELPVDVAGDGAGHFAVIDASTPVTRVFDPDGTPRTGAFLAAAGDDAAVGASAEGNFLVAYSDSEGMKASAFDVDGQTLGTPVLISPGYHEQPGQGISVPGVAADGRGDFVVVWANRYDAVGYGRDYGVWGRRVAVCGNGRLTPGLGCDDGNSAPGDGCSPTCDVDTCHGCSGEPSACTPLPGCTVYCSAAAGITDKATLTIGRALAPAGDEALTFKGAIVGAPLAAGQVNPLAEGVEVAITGTGVVYQRSAPLPVPPGASGSGCGPLDGWKASGRAPNRSFTYKNLSNALPPACTPGSANGLRSVKVKDRIARDGTIQFEVKTKASTLPPAPGAPLTGTIVLGQSPAAGLSGRCARIVFTRAVSGNTVRYYP